jgi:hypothetical protein
VVGVSPIDTFTPKTLFVACPPGKMVIGGGVALIPPIGPIDLSIRESIPDSPAPGIEGWTVTVEDPTYPPSSTAPWGIEAVAICAVVAP